MNNLKRKIEQLKSDPGKIFGLIYPYFMVIIVAAGLLYVNNLGNIARQNVLPAPPDTLIHTDLPVIEPRTVPAINIMEMRKPTQELLSQGKEIYNTICSSCHGEDGRGSGPAAAGLNPQPRNLTVKDGWMNGQKISEIYKTLEEGIPGTGMISYNYLPPSNRIALAHYIRETFVPAPPEDTDNELTTSDQTYSLSQGKEIAAQIPVERAMNLLLQENKTAVQNIMQKVSQVESSREPGAVLFNRVTNNKVLAITTLSSDMNWKQDYQKFIRSAMYNSKTNGFNNNIFKLSADEWNILHNYMSRLF